jgi:hypothetical protein
VRTVGRRTPVTVPPIPLPAEWQEGGAGLGSCIQVRGAESDVGLWLLKEARTRGISSFSRAVERFERDSWVELCNEVRRRVSENPREVLGRVGGSRKGLVVDETDRLEGLTMPDALDDIEVRGNESLISPLLEWDTRLFCGAPAGDRKAVIFS